MRDEERQPSRVGVWLMLCVSACGSSHPPTGEARAEPAIDPVGSSASGEPAAEPGAVPAGAACGSHAPCAGAEVCCPMDCAGTLGCALEDQCPELACEVCPAGTCRRAPGGACGWPTGPLGNACCACGADGMCSSFCRCLLPSTPIETASGPRAIGTLSVGDLVTSVERGERTLVPILRVVRAAAPDHHLVHVRLATGAELYASPGHPTADGRVFADLGPDDVLDGVRVVEAHLEPYGTVETVDILPASDTGTYVASGVLVGSTLFGRSAMAAGTE